MPESIRLTLSARVKRVKIIDRRKFSHNEDRRSLTKYHRTNDAWLIVQTDVAALFTRIAAY